MSQKGMENRTLRIAVADDELDTREFLERILSALGHQVVVVASTGQELCERCLKENPDLIITDIRMPDMDGIDAAVRICQTRPIPVILVSAYHDPELIERARNDHVMAYLVKPIEQADLEPAIALATMRFEQFRALLQEAANLRQALADRKIIEQAKGIVMKRSGLDESQAFRRLQKFASEQQRKLTEVAQMILIVEKVFHDEPPSPARLKEEE